MTWHWVITLRWVIGRGETATCTAHGTFSPQQAAQLGTRGAAYDAIIAFIQPPAGVSDGTRPMVLFFSLEPDELPAAAPTLGGA